jgi:hypothetical protein
MKECLNFCIPGMHLIEIYYNSSVLYTDLIYASTSGNLNTVQNKGLLHLYMYVSACKAIPDNGNTLHISSIITSQFLLKNTYTLL